MAILIEMTNNPYSQSLQILMDGAPVSPYSGLKKYMDKPFEDWCDKIFEAIHQECNFAKYTLHYRSRDEEIIVMQKLAADDPYCERFTSSGLVRGETLTTRMSELNRIIREQNCTGIPTEKIRAVFAVSSGLDNLTDEIRDLQIRNSYCETEVTVCPAREYRADMSDADICFLVTKDEDEKELAKQLGFRKGYSIHIGEESVFLGKDEDVFYYRASEPEFFDIVFSCFMLGPLLEAFRSAFGNLPETVRSRCAGRLEALMSIYPAVIPEPVSRTVELGRSCRISFRSDVPGYSVDVNKLHFDYSVPGVISCNGFQVDGLKEGRATLLIFRDGENNPCASEEFNVIVRNRITNIYLDDDAIVLGEGDTWQMEYTYYPGDADNVNTIEWESDGSEVAVVSGDGRVTAVKAGECTLYCIAERVSARCRCTVKPYMTGIEAETKEICMMYGTSAEILYRIEPVDCIDSEVEISSRDMRIVNVVGNTLRGAGVGETTVVLENHRKTIREEIRVTVLDERSWNKKEKKKNSFWKRLLGD